MFAWACLATPNQSDGVQFITLALGWLLGVLSLGLCELAFLGYLKLQELTFLWRARPVGAKLVNAAASSAPADATQPTVDQATHPTAATEQKQVVRPVAASISRLAPQSNTALDALRCNATARRTNHHTP